MPDVWRVYRVKQCRHTHPPKDKFVVIVCIDSNYMGFLVNSEINQFTVRNPHLLQCQIPLSKKDNHFLFHDSYLDCARIYSFRDEELNIGLDILDTKIQERIKGIVTDAKTLEKRYINLILLQ